ncbi:MAG: glycoside hydrolase family 32 protein [Anaerolineae bacterium]|nr:glycoside hydrolase family 32 protein [Anaerolineae bacterium]
MKNNLISKEKKRKINLRIQEDIYAPQYHFIAPEGNALPFDPNGAIYWKGKYHLFYIFQDSHLPQGGHCWGHASSPDLLHWTYHPTALTPAEDDPDAGIFSGNAFVSREGVPTLAYFGIGAGICLAQSTDDDLSTWTKLEGNPVISIPQPGDPGWGIYNVFDPHIWFDGTQYFAILGGNVKPGDLYDTAYLFKSQDLVHWEYLSPFYTPHPEWTEPVEDCACPDFFQIGDRHMLLCISHSHGTRYYLGHLENERFIPEEHHRMNWPGGSCFAPESLVDSSGRRVFWAWVPDQRKGDSIYKKELGVMSLPRELAMDAQGQLLIQPAGELASLRQKPWTLESLHLSSPDVFQLPEIHGNSLEILIDALLPEHGRLGVNVFMHPDGDEQTTVTVDVSKRTLSVDTRYNSLRKDIVRYFPMMRGEPRIDVGLQVAPFTLMPGENLQLRIFIDRSIIEVFANGRQCVTQRVYPTLPDSQYIGLGCERGDIVVNNLTVWTIKPTNL